MQDEKNFSLPQPVPIQIFLVFLKNPGSYTSREIEKNVKEFGLNMSYAVIRKYMRAAADSGLLKKEIKKLKPVGFNGSIPTVIFTLNNLTPWQK